MSGLFLSELRYAEEVGHPIGDDDAVVDGTEPAAHDDAHTAGVENSGHLFGKPHAHREPLELGAEAGAPEVASVVHERAWRRGFAVVYLFRYAGKVVLQTLHRGSNEALFFLLVLDLGQRRPVLVLRVRRRHDGVAGRAGTDLRIIERKRSAGRPERYQRVGVEVRMAAGEEQLPDVYKRYCDLATRMELDPIPRLYLVNGNGVLNAFASRCQLRRNYVVIFSDLLEVAYELNDFSTVDFVLAHELGHIKCGHVAFWRSAIAALPAAVRFTPSMIRAQEYTADRVAMYYAPTGAEGLLVLFAGKRMHRHCDHAAYVKSIRNHKDGFWLKFTNIFSDHAVGFRRYSAIAEAEEKGWDVHGKMI